MFKKILTLAPALLLITSTSSYAQTDDDLVRQQITKKAVKKIKDDPEYSRTLQDIINEQNGQAPNPDETTTDANDSEQPPLAVNDGPGPVKKLAKKPKHVDAAEISESIEKPAQQAVVEANKALEQATIEADDLSYDKNSKILTAENNVILGYQGKEVRSDKIEYDQSTKMIIADNGAQFKDVTGTIFKAKKVDVSDKFDKGNMHDVDVDFGDGSSFHSEDLTILGASTYDLDRSIYTPCDMCFHGKPLWQVDAKKVHYSEEDGRVYYKDAYLKLLGQKLVWMPYLSHPTPYAQSKSGFLSPKFGNSSTYGFFARVPYYYQPRSNLDFTFTPLITAGDGPILDLQMRHLIETGYYELEVSGANPRETDINGKPVPGGGNVFRGHVKGSGDFTYGDNWEYGFDATRTSDDTYLRRYNFGHYEDVLDSEAFADYMKDRDYFQIKFLSFQDLRANVIPAQQPTVTPLIDAGQTYQVSDKYNSRIETNYNTMVLNRDDGADSNRAIAGAKWKADYATSSGHLFNVSMGTRADYYDVNDVNYFGTSYSGDPHRIIPEGSATWSYPLQKLGETYSMIVEPITMIVASPNGSNSLKIPNEDSQSVDLSDYNLFQEDHILGYDLVEGGLRVNYGTRGVISSDKLGDYNFLLGQGYRAKKDDTTFSQNSGLADNFSDYVGRVITGGKKFSSSYRFRIDKDNARFKRNEVGFNINTDPIQFNTGYTFIAGEPGFSTDRQEVASNTTIKLNDSYSLISHATRNLDNDNDAGWVNAGIGINFTNKCLTSSFEINKEFTRDRDITPATEFIIKINLKNFGS